MLVIYTNQGFLKSFKGFSPKNNIPADGVYLDQTATTAQMGRKPPVISVRNQRVPLKRSCLAVSFLEQVVDAEGNNLIGEVKVKGPQVDATGHFYAGIPGCYWINYQVTDQAGIWTSKNIRIIVE
jgi:hypothetical protein